MKAVYKTGQVIVIATNAYILSIVVCLFVFEENKLVIVSNILHASRRCR